MMIFTSTVVCNPIVIWNTRIMAYRSHIAAENPQGHWTVCSLMTHADIRWSRYGWNDPFTGHTSARVE